jgi:hypothetical protein
MNQAHSTPYYSWRPHPYLARCYQIIRKNEENQGFEPVGEYLVLDEAEGAALSEKKVTNLTSLINGRPEEVMQLGHMTDRRIFFHRVPKQPEDAQTKVVFLARDPSGLMHENAILFLEAGIVDDE